MTSLWVTVASARSMAWGRNDSLTVLYLVPWASALMCSMQTQGLETFLIITTEQNLHWYSRQLCTSFTVPQVSEHFFQAVILLTYVVATKIWSYDKLDLWNINHILGFTTANFLSICRMNIAALAIFQAWIWVRVGVGKFFFDYVLKSFSPRKWTFWLHASIWLTACSIAFL